MGPAILAGLDSPLSMPLLGICQPDRLAHNSLISWAIVAFFTSFESSSSWLSIKPLVEGIGCVVVELLA